ncbi:MAG TPA: ornithine cyclodeaminase family protein [Thermoanaerobaculia bacterium]|nr:ornithine cyclodeaminase family protein [Thermoanaerobaculia bacterium]
MKTVVLAHGDVVDLLPIGECIELMEEALGMLARGEVHQPLRSLVRASGSPRGFLGLMPGWRGGEKPFWGLKEICLFPGNPAVGLDTHLGVVLLHSGETGELLAIVEASAVTAIRTAAVTAVATRLLARADASELAIVGTGVQARSHLGAIAAVRTLRRVRVAGRTPEKGREFAQRMQPDFPAPIEPMETVEQAVRGADLVVTATSSREPVLRAEWIAPGAHVNLVGSSVKGAREADGPTMAAARLFVDRRESTENESGDYLMAIAEGAIGPDHIVAEIGEVLLDPRRGRRSEDEITMFKSLGLAIEDLAAAARLWENAKRTRRGTWIDLL